MKKSQLFNYSCPDVIWTKGWMERKSLYFCIAFQKSIFYKYVSSTLYIQRKK